MKYYVLTNTNVWTIETENGEKPRVDSLPKRIRSENIEGIYPMSGHHICKYCGGIAKGSNKDILCDECKDVFGHTLYSEL